MHFVLNLVPFLIFFSTENVGYQVISFIGWQCFITISVRCNTLQIHALCFTALLQVTNFSNFVVHLRVWRALPTGVMRTWNLSAVCPYCCEHLDILWRYRRSRYGYYKLMWVFVIRWGHEMRKLSSECLCFV